MPGLGQGFTVGRLALLIFLEIIDKTTNGSPATRDSSGLLVDIFEFAGRYVFFIRGDVEFAPDFRTRPPTK